MFHTVPVLTMFHAPLGPALISGTTAQSCLPSWQKIPVLFLGFSELYNWRFGIVGYHNEEGVATSYAYSFKFLPLHVRSLCSLVSGPLMDYLPAWQKIYFYNWG